MKKDVLLHQTKKGYIVLVTMLMISLAVVIVTYIYKRGSLYAPYAQLVAHKEKASLLTMSGLHVALANLGQPISVSKDKKDEKKGVPADNGQAERILFYQWLFPRLNRWNHFNLKEEIDGVDATISVAIGAEEGKINLNQWYDFTTKTFRVIPQTGFNAELVLKELCTALEAQLHTQNLFEAFKKFLNNRTEPLDDITQLLAIKECAEFKNFIFYQPPHSPSKDENSTPHHFYLTDLFTLYTPDHTLDPWVFSDSISGFLGLPRVTYGDTENRLKQFEPVLKKYKSTYTWKSDWKLFLEPIYQKELQSLPKGIESVLQEKTNPQIFSIFVTATYGKVTQQLYSIVERASTKDAQKNSYKVEVRKIYRI